MIMDYKKKYKEALERARVYHTGGSICDAHMTEVIFPELKESEDEGVRKEIIRILKGETGYTSKEDTDKYVTWLEKQGVQKQTWKPNAAQLIVIKDLIEDKNTSKVNKVILRGMFDEFKQFTNTNKREIDDAYLQGICDAKHEIEKQGKQKTDPCTDCTNDKGCVTCENGNLKEIKIGPKFKVGNWVVEPRDGEPNGLWHIERIEDDHYWDGINGVRIEHADKYYHLWTIQDAKEGDVLVHNNCTFIFMGIKNGIVYALEEHLLCDTIPVCFGEPDKDNDYHPATKEQRDLLFRNIKEAGYQWDNEKNELKKMETSNKESDKKIELEIRNFIWRYPEKLPERYKWLAWFEKQDKKKSVDEVLKIRQELYQSGYNDGYKHGQEDKEKELHGKLIEKQGEQKSTDKAEPKFKVGDWL